MTPIFPFLEANQGALSLLALVLALMFALWEARRANDAPRARCREALELVAASLELCQERLENALASAHASPRENSNETVQAIVAYNLAMERVQEAVDVVLTSAPPSAEVLVSLTEIRGSLLNNKKLTSATFPKSVVTQRIEEQIGALRQGREACLAMRDTFKARLFPLPMQWRAKLARAFKRRK